MKYFAAVVSNDEVLPVVLYPPYQILCSYHYFKKKQELIRSYVQAGYDVFIDSGAFSAKTKGIEIDIDAYCQFIIDTKVSTYAGLDVIGDARKTEANTKYMVDQYGLDPIPTFHMGGDVADLRALFKHSYIALGGMVFSSGRERYCDEIWGIILREKPTLRVHGFGMTNIDLMRRYPWYSVDSSTYKDGRRFGRPQILWGGFELREMKEQEFYDFLAKQHCKAELTNKEKLFLMDLHSVQAYKVYGEHLRELNKIKNFDYLTNQQKLF